MTINVDLNTIPAPLRDEVQLHLGEFGSLPAAQAILDRPVVAENLARVWACSPFIARYCYRHIDAFEELVSSGELETSNGDTAISDRLRDASEDCATEEAYMRCLREIRNREMVRIGWRDIAGACELPETLRDLSQLADACLQVTLDWLVGYLSSSLGRPYDRAGEEQAMVVIAMGKLGARELNYSSDIDLIFCYTKTGETQGGRRSVSSEQYFDRLARLLIKMINDITADGYVFRVDMRLRPFGDSGPLVTSMDAMEGYYEAHARDWERYAMIKARIAAGNQTAGEELMQMLRPFVFRRYIDFGALESLRDMKKLINDEVRRKGIHDNVKLGAGGIREIEFIGQVFQLIRGGKEPSLRKRSILAILQSLEKLELMTAETVTELTSAYWFLRNSEHRLQQVNDQQTQTLPTDEKERARIAFGMGFGDWQQFSAELQAHRDRVSSHFRDLLRPPEEEGESDKELSTMVSLWHGNIDGEAAEALLTESGFRESAASLEQIRQLREMRSTRQLSLRGQTRLDRLMPLILDKVCISQAPDLTLKRMLKLVEAIARRSTYLTLLTENPTALQQTINLFSESAWVAEQIIAHPLLLDELIDPRILFSPPGPAELQKDLLTRLYKCQRDDIEQYMDSLRHFKNAQVLRVAAADITGNLPLAEVSNHLSAIAEAVLDTALLLAWNLLTEKHGSPQYTDNQGQHPAGFCIIAYGKLGGLELGYSSDLDLVFLHDSHGGKQMTDGDRSLDNNVFFNRLGQRIISLLTTVTSAGTTYEIDPRLRPNGASGILVGSMESFNDYQHKEAWTWEHQALVRARVVAGNPRTAERFRAIRKAVLGNQRDADTLRADIVDMREKMRKELDRSETGIFDLKQGRGGITDIEFMVQYGVLRWAATHPELLTWTDNLRLLDDLARLGLLGTGDCEQLREAYFAYRAVTHRRALQKGKALVGDDEFLEHRQRVLRIWNEFMGEQQ